MIRSFLDPVRALSGDDGRWLMLGKGPSFERFGALDPGGRRVCALNHVIGRGPADLAHAADLDVIETCGEAILRNARLLVMPWRPHGPDFLASLETLEDLAARHPALGRLAAEDRLLCYNLGTARGLPPHPDAPWIEPDLFSGAVVGDLLAMAGAREIRTLGIDGGARYAGSFQTLETTTLLSHGAPSFDSQFRRLAAMGRRQGVAWGPLYAEVPLRAVIAAGPGQRLQAAVLAHGLASRARGAVAAEVIDPAAQGAAEPAALAARAGFAGRLLRLTPDLATAGDPLALWTADFDGAPGLTAANGQAVLIDAAHPDWAEGSAAAMPAAGAAAEVFLDFAGRPPPWRAAGAAATDPAAALWRATLRAALAEGAVSSELLRVAILADEADAALLGALALDPAGHAAARFDAAGPDGDDLDAVLRDPARWRALIAEGAADRTARKAALPPPPQSTGWRSWPGRALRRAARWWDSRL